MTVATPHMILKMAHSHASHFVVFHVLVDRSVVSQHVFN